MPNRLFHYQRFNPDYTASLLTERKIKLSRPDNFNDPWDCRVHYQMPPDEMRKKDVIDWITTAHRKHHPEISEAKRARLAFELKSDDARLRQGFEKMERDFYAVICQRYRVYCLTEKPDCPIMWAHYADSHRGICLEFDSTQSPFTSATGITKIRYHEEYPAYNLASSMGGYEALFTKSSHWAYEAEWRLIAEERQFAIAPLTVKTDNDFLILPPGVLKSITIGSLASEQTREQIRRIMKTNAPDVLMRQMEIAPDRYALIANLAF